MVRRARMVAARTSAGAARKGPRRSLRAADCPHRRRQDAGRIPADAGGAERSSAHVSVTSPLVGEVDARRAAGGGRAASTERCGLPLSPTPPHKGGGPPTPPPPPHPRPPH